MHNKGQLIARRYRLETPMGSNKGMSATWAATDIRTTQAVVIKFLRIEDAKDWKMIELFEREIDVLRALEHPNIPRLLEGHAEPGEEWFLAQERAPGASIQSAITNHKRFSEDSLLAIAIQMLKILVYLQKESPPVIHRDIKPDNILIDDNGSIYLVDFGAASLSHSNHKMGGSTVVGTFGYMAPEQFRGIANNATDLYGLGMTLVVMATGKQPEELETHSLKVQFEAYTNLSLPFERWLTTMIEPDHSQRFANAEEALAALRSRKTSNGGDILARIESSDISRFRHISIEPGAHEVSLIHKMNNFLTMGYIFSFIGALAAIGTAITLLIEPMMGLFFFIFAAVFGGIGLNIIRSREILTFNRDDIWTWNKRNLFGEKEESGQCGEIIQLEATPSNTTINNQRLYRLSMATDFGKHHIFTGFDRHEAQRFAKEISAITGAPLADDNPGIRFHLSRAMDSALEQASKKSGMIGTMAKTARQLSKPSSSQHSANTSKSREASSQHVPQKHPVEIYDVE